jgi:hypothetical protein
MKQESIIEMSKNNHSSNKKTNDNSEKINHSNNNIRKKTAVHDVSHVVIQDFHKVNCCLLVKALFD